MNLETAAAVQQIIQAPNKFQAWLILSSLQPGIQQQVQEAFRTNLKLRELFPEFVEVVEKGWQS